MRRFFYISVASDAIGVLGQVPARHHHDQLYYKIACPPPPLVANGRRETASGRTSYPYLDNLTISDRRSDMNTRSDRPISVAATSGHATSGPEKENAMCKWCAGQVAIVKRAARIKPGRPNLSVYYQNLSLSYTKLLVM